MGILAIDARDRVIVPACRILGLLSASATNLLLSTWAQETELCATGLIQHRNGGKVGPALGPFQMEPATFYDTWSRSASGHRALVLRHVAPADLDGAGVPKPELMVTDLRFAAMLARLKYRLAPPALPAADDLDALWRYYKRWWNSEEGAATEAQWRRNWTRYAAGAAVDPGAVLA